MQSRNFTKSDIKNIIYLGLGIVIFRNVAKFITGVADKFTPDKPTPQQKENANIEKGEVPVTKKGTGLNLKRFDSDTYLLQRVEKLKQAFLDNNQTNMQNALIPVKSDADFKRMSELFGDKFYFKFTLGNIGTYNLSTGIQAFMSAYSRARVNQSWANNKKYPNYITFKL